MSITARVDETVYENYGPEGDVEVYREAQSLAEAGAGNIDSKTLIAAALSLGHLDADGILAILRETRRTAPGSHTMAIAARANFREDVNLSPSQRSLNPPEFRRLSQELLALGLIAQSEIEPPGAEYNDEALPDEQRVILLDPMKDDILAILRGAGNDVDRVPVGPENLETTITYDPLDSAVLMYNGPEAGDPLEDWAEFETIGSRHLIPPRAKQ